MPMIRQPGKAKHCIENLEFGRYEEDAGAFFTLFVPAWALHGYMKNPCDVTLVRPMVELEI